MRYSPPLRSEEKVKGLIPQMPLITAELIPSSILHLPSFYTSVPAKIALMAAVPIFHREAYSRTEPNLNAKETALQKKIEGYT